MKRLLQAYHCKGSRTALRQLDRWYDSPAGRRLHDEEAEQMAQALPTLFGYHLMQVGLARNRDWLAGSRIPHRFVMRQPGVVELNGEKSPLVASAEQLPIAADTLDLLILPHVLEFSDDPHSVLREADRVLIPEGHLLILGFNPFSLWGVTRLWRGWRKEAPWCGHFYSVQRLRDWLQLLGFDTVAVNYYHYRIPTRHPGLDRRLGFLERLGRRFWPIFGGGYLLLARKRVVTLTPIRPRWRAGRRLINAGLSQTRLNRSRQDEQGRT